MAPEPQSLSTCFATCPRGLESLLKEELQSLGVAAVRETVAGVAFQADLPAAYRCCLWSRLANRILLQLADLACNSADELYRCAADIDWQHHLALDNTFAVSFSGSLKGVTHSHFGALRIKDAIADQFYQRHARRPNVDPKQPDVLVNARAAKGRVVISIDLSGDSLHKRGYRQQGGVAPLKENLAAAILLRADWPAIAARGGALLDPMCGSGTLLIEGAMMAAQIAPGLLRQRWGFSEWRGHQPAVWEQLRREASTQRQLALKRQWPEIRGYDAHPRSVDLAQQCIDKAGLNGRIRVLRKDLAQFRKPTHTDVATGLIITNPPYGERLGEAESLLHLYRHLAQAAKQHFEGWQMGVFTGNPELGKRMGLRSRKQYALYNGTIASKLLLFDIVPDNFIEPRTGSSPDFRPATNDQQSLSDQQSPAPLDEGVAMFANRLRKNIKALKKWLQRESISCYRLYDADLPEYAVAIDRYNDWLHVAEYAPPASVDPDLAERRLQSVVAVLPEIVGVDARQVVVKQRRRQRGHDQYRKHDQRREFIEVQEGQARLLVNLHDYLDTGLFLDHRIVRLDIAARARGKRFLNLFCYTATATVHAALGGASYTDSVDLSSTYLDWGRKNLALNGFSETQHRLQRADVLEWLRTCNKRYDLILLDPPTFSNSKKMQDVLDIQRDHCELIHQVMGRLEPDGLLIFSNNHRKFTFDPRLAEEFTVEDKTQWSLDKDFQGHKRTHQCWYIRHRSE